MKTNQMSETDIDGATRNRLELRPLTCNKLGKQNGR